MQLWKLIPAILMICPAASANHWYSSKHFWGTFAATVVVESGDYYTSQRCFARGFTEQNPIFLTSRPSYGRMFSIGTPIDFGLNYAGYKMSKSRFKLVRKLELLPSGVAIGSHVWGIQNNTRLLGEK